MTPTSPTGTVGVIVVAAGSGSRLGAEVPKAFVTLGDATLLTHAVCRAGACPGVTHLVVVAPAGHRDEAAACVAAAELPATVTTLVVAGGAERTDSVAAGLTGLPPQVDVVLVHDAARALAPTALFVAVAEAVRSGHPAVVPGLPVVDTVKQVDAHGEVVATPDRAWLRAVQTPQGFARDVLERAHAAGAGGVTDDAGLVERLGLPVLVVAGDERALKITTAPDLTRALALLHGADPVVT